jgi:hypothetical protein
MVIERAVMAPVVLAVPRAVAHLPTARALDVAEVRSVKVVDEVRVTTTLVAFFVCGLVSLTVTVEPDTAVTEPEANPNRPLANPPAGRDPLPGVPPPSGLLPLVVRPGKFPRPPKPPPPKPPVHFPSVGWVMLTVVAVTGPPNACVPVDDPEPVAGVPVAVMHEPTVTSAAVAETVCSKVVDDV